MKKNYIKAGVSLVELMVSVALVFVVVGGVLALNMFAQAVWKSERAKSNVIGQMETCMEKMQKEIRMTDAQQIFYYPADAAAYTAISFPLAVDDNNDSFIELDASGKISWDQTVIYHTYTNEQNKVELRRTVFTSRTALSASNRQKQLNDVVANGHPVSDTPEYSKWNSDTGTRALCKNDNIELTITPILKEFDGYKASTEKSENVTFGSISLAAGAHLIKFTVSGKNPLASGGRKIGIDCFTVTPSGASWEAEETIIDSDGGSSKVNEDMSTYGNWSGNRQLEYQSDTVGDYITYKFYYDQWLETNFASSSPYYTLIEYGARTGDAGELAGTSDYVTRLGGCGDSWSALAQTGAAAKTTPTVTIYGDAGIIFRNVIMSRNVEVEGRAIKIKFDNASAESITIDYAGIMSRINGPDGDSATLKTITFGGLASVSIAAGSSAPSDWIDINNFDRNKDYLLTFHIPFAKDSTHYMSCWATPAADVMNDHSYVLEGPSSVADDETWTGKTGLTPSDKIYSVDSIYASYFSQGTITSQIYDTGMAGPQYSTLAWNIAKNNYGNYAPPISGLGANLIIKVRSNDSKAALLAAVDWTGVTPAIDTLSRLTGSEDITSIGTGRYVQFQAEFLSKPTPGSYDYLKTCVLKNITISWPGQSRIADIGGYFTKRPDYGIFSVSVDGYKLTRGIELDLKISENLSHGRVITRSVKGEVEPRNTGK